MKQLAYLPLAEYSALKRELKAARAKADAMLDRWVQAKVLLSRCKPHVSCQKLLDEIEEVMG